MGVPAGETGTADRTETPSNLTDTTATDAAYPISLAELTRGAPRDGIAAIVDPVFADDWSGLTVPTTDAETGESVELEPRLHDDDRVIGVAQDGDARAYPLAVLFWHEVVNDSLNGPVLVTYCPLCRTGLATIRTVNGSPTIFGVSGYLYNSNLVMYDQATDSLWSQIEAVAIHGPQSGERLSILTSTMSTWDEWTDSYPETDVLLPPPESSTVRGRWVTRDYTVNPYAGYEQNRQAGLGNDSPGAGETPTPDSRLHPKAVVLGITHGGETIAYPLSIVSEAGGVVNDRVGDLPVVIATVGESDLVSYVRRVDDQVIQFTAGNEGEISGGDSRWDLTSGEALDGPFEGSVLRRATDRSPMFWFAWVERNPDTQIYGIES